MQEDIHEMTRGIKFVAAFALLLTLAACGDDSPSRDDSSSWSEEPSEPCEAVGYATHGVGSTWTWAAVPPDDCEACESIGEDGDILAYEACLLAYHSCMERRDYDWYEYVPKYITYTVAGRTTYRGRDVVVITQVATYGTP